MVHVHEKYKFRSFIQVVQLSQKDRATHYVS